MNEIILTVKYTLNREDVENWRKTAAESGRDAGNRFPLFLLRKIEQRELFADETEISIEDAKGGEA